MIEHALSKLKRSPSLKERMKADRNRCSEVLKSLECNTQTLKCASGSRQPFHIQNFIIKVSPWAIAYIDVALTLRPAKLKSKAQMVCFIGRGMTKPHFDTKGSF